MIKDTIFEDPIALLEIKDSKLRKAIDDYLPFSSAFEVECSIQPHFDIQVFKDIPDIMDASGGDGEQRFRVPAGLKGLVCLYRICEQLKRDSELNPQSGIHYHTDCTDIWELITDEHVKSNEEWILDELDTWDYNYTSPSGRGIFSRDSRIRYHSNNGFYGWVAFNCLKTIEIRVGEMTFDYEIISKRMIHCNSIVRRFKLAVLEGQHKMELENLQTQLKELQSQRNNPSLDNMVFGDVAKEVIKTRNIRI